MDDPEHSSQTSMMYQVVGMLLLCVIFLIVWLFACRRNRHLIDMETPLLSGESVDHRIDAATREAEAGFSVCASCDFENFKRFEYCVLCGDKLLSLSITTDEDGSTDDCDRSPYPFDTDQERRESLITSPTANRGTIGHLLSPRSRKLSSLTRQQRRARNRREWSRKLDVEGNLFWYRSGGSDLPVSTEVNALMPGYTLSFKIPEHKDLKVEEKHAAEANNDEEEVEQWQQEDDEDLVMMDVVTEAVETEETLQEMRDKFFEKLALLTGVEAELTEASASQPAEFSTGKSTLVDAGPERRKEIVALAASDFPSKYAHFVVSTASLIVPAEVEFLKLSVHRDYMLEESLDHMVCIQPRNLRSFMRINFLDESGVDAGGVHREWFMLVNELLVSPTLRLFTCTNKADQSYFFNPQSRAEVGEDHLACYFATGRLIGRALLEGGIWGFHLALPLLKVILGVPVTFADMEFLDPETYRSLRWLMDNDGVEDLELDFSLIEVVHGSEKVVVDLVPNGRHLVVTDANKREYLDRRFRYALFESVADQMYAFLSGLYEVIPRDMLLLFDPEEFDYLLCGSPEIDVTDWEAHTVLTPNLENASLTRWFWEIVRQMPNEYRRRLLLFATGSACVPLSGFRGLTSYDGRLCPFNLKGVSYQVTQYISSHACFNRLDLPLYHNKKELKSMLYATLDTDLTGFTTA
uniref:HECT-type E3 ubiquitin transferase n=1 Tax=Peronospora matthiolae TaxID=2874970 RepID=A0AAV1TD69_9STRA